jgi:hypothetical protein
MMSLGELQISFPLFFCTKNSANDLISGNFDSEKVDEDEVFLLLRYITFLLRMTQILHKPKIIFGVSRTLNVLLERREDNAISCILNTRRKYARTLSAR